MNQEQQEAAIAEARRAYTKECIDAGHRFGLAEGRWNGLWNGILCGGLFGFAIGVLVGKLLQ